MTCRLMPAQAINWMVKFFSLLYSLAESRDEECNEARPYRVGLQPMGG